MVLCVGRDHSRTVPVLRIVRNLKSLSSERDGLSELLSRGECLSSSSPRLRRSWQITVGNLYPDKDLFFSFLGATKEPPIAFAFPDFRRDEGAAYCFRFSRFKRKAAFRP